MNKTTRKKTTKNDTFVKVLRAIIYLVSIIGATIGACLVRTGSLSSAIADGTSKIKISIGEPLFGICIIIFALNLIWGIIRFVLRGNDEHWSTGRTIFKIIGGILGRAAIFGIIFLISAFLIYPRVSNAVVARAYYDDPPISLSKNIDTLQYIDDNFDSLNYDDYKDELAGLMFNNINFDTDASSNVSTSPASVFYKNVSAYTPKVTTLNKAKLSDAGHFVIFYTDTGDDKISDDTATNLCEMLEHIIANYESNLGFTYEYKTLTNNIFSISKMQAVLENSGIDKDIINTAMPVYIADPYKNGSNTLASYAGTRFKNLGLSILIKLGGLLGEETSKIYNSTPSYPFVNITPGSANSESLAIVTAHELGHHYGEVYNENHYGSSGSLDDFTGETAPNWMAINVLPDEPADTIVNANHYNKVYLSRSTGDTVSKASSEYDFLGYPSVAFLQNYYEIVPDAIPKIMDATYYGDALNHLYNSAGADYFKQVMVSLAEKNLTGDYGGKLKNTEMPQGVYFGCADICSRDYLINAASTKYLYFATSEYQDSTIEFKSWGSTGEVYFSVLGQNASGNWEIISSAKLSGEYEINESIQSKYATIAIAVANSSVEDIRSFTVKIAKTKVKEIITDEGDFDFSRYGDFFAEKGSGCYEIDTDELFNELTELVDAGAVFLQAITNLQKAANPDVDYSSEEAEYERGAEEAKKAFAESKAELAPYEVVVCANYINSNSEYNTTKTKIKNALSGTLNIYNIDEEDESLSIFVSFDPLAQNAKVYFLAKVEGEMGLVTVNLSEK